MITRLSRMGTAAGPVRESCFYYSRPSEKRQYNAHRVSSPGQVFSTKYWQLLPQGDTGFADLAGCVSGFPAMHPPRIVFTRITISGFQKIARILRSPFSGKLEKWRTTGTFNREGDCRAGVGEGVAPGRCESKPERRNPVVKIAVQWFLFQQKDDELPALTISKGL
ncbi:hypothetical protein [Methanoregula sp.]|uniref:hypothetical protein n=1 Tax=Methanoregula sp. TaxID=2052170 RepID=UPI003C70F8A6